ncbi:hypothetical protein [Nocardioides dongkuii]|uniref:hypothetical protein n=1 Tax=Nocardioides dongkuii TaxID=2760089 RepID=UPI0018782EED|nr:hypothetical protein [Nocardioides dongkuii]
MSDQRPEPTGPILLLVLLVLVALVAVAWSAGYRSGADAPSPEPRESSGAPVPASPVESSASAAPPAAPATAPEPKRATLPHGGTRVFAGNRFLVAYYGTAGSGALGVLGETRPAGAEAAVRRAALPFRRPGQPVQPVYELIVTIADRHPGRDGDHSHDIARRDVRRYLDVAREDGALVVLDLQPGTSDFLEVAKRWEWALRQPHVGLALDPEWRMSPGQVPGRVIGHARAAEVNRTSAWLAALVRRHRLPEKLFVLHQFRTSMLPDLRRVQRRPGLALVQHVDGFGTRGQKMETYETVARPGRFTMGLKLFYDEDVRRMGPGAVHAVRPRVRFVSFQ